MEAKNNNVLNLLLKLGFIEGISFLLLVFICMPLKYLWNIPEPVRYIGIIHGVLFLLFFVVLYYAKEYFNWKIKKVFLGFLLSVIPFGTFYLDRVLKK
jgi:integral membrane protein